MPDPASVVVIGGTSGIGREIARFYAERGHDVVLSGRDAERARAVAAEFGGRVTGIAWNWPGRRRSVPPSPRSVTWTTWSSRRSTATRTRSATTT